MKFLKLNAIFAAVIFYLIVISAFLLHFSTSTKVGSQEQYVESEQKTVQYQNAIPSFLEISSIKLEIAVETGKYDQESDTWNITDNSAYYAQESMPLASKVGNSVIYAHNKQHLFGNLKNLKPGDTAQITDSNGVIHEYVYQKNIEISPSNTDVFYSQDTYNLILLTCSGLFDQYRTLYYFLQI
jgi:LPXTG-site transpeptidase (sortase) family protein